MGPCGWHGGNDASAQSDRNDVVKVGMRLSHLTTTVAVAEILVVVVDVEYAVGDGVLVRVFLKCDRSRALCHSRWRCERCIHRNDSRGD